MRTLQIILILVFSAILFTGCLKGEIKTIGSGLGEGDLTCPSNKNTKALVSVYDELNTKLIREEFEDLTGDGKAKVLNNQNTLILKNTQIIVKANRDCVLSQDNSDLAISNQIRPQVMPVTNKKAASFGYFVYILETDLLLQDLEEIANNDKCILGLSPNKKIELQALNDEKYPIQNNMVTIKHDIRHQKILNEIQDEVLVAVVDSGNTQDHPDMLGRHWKNTVEQNGQAGIDDDGNGFIDDIFGYSWACYVGGDRPTSFWHTPHGEHVAGIIAANMNNTEGVAGIAGQKAKMMHLNVIYSGNPAQPCNGTFEDLVLAIQGIQYAADNGAKVINLSMGKFARSSAMQDVMIHAVSQGAFVASAAGNNAKLVLDNETDFFYPCGYAKDIDGFSCVGATDANPGVENTRCAFSNYSDQFVELTAPGCDTTVGNQHFGLNGVLSTVRGTDDLIYKYMPGTSMATPHIAAAGAIVMGYLKTKRGTYPTPAEVEDILKNGSRFQANLASEFQQGRAMDLDKLFTYIDDVVLGGDDSGDNGGSCP